MPTKSAIAGMCCAALGHERGSDEERTFLAAFAGLRMTVLSGTRKSRSGKATMRRLEDYHTVQNTMKADGKTKDCHITHRQYLTDAAFAVLLHGALGLVREVAAGLADPRWGIWLGRKACVPTAPVLVGVFDTRDEALRELIGDQPLDAFTRQEEVEQFADGKDSLPDQAISFLSSRREFAPRRVITIQGK